MKLARVEHYRCEQPAGKWGLSTYVWVADDMTSEEFHTRCSAAAEKLLEYERSVKASAPVQPPGYGASILPNTPDNMTVGELKANYAALATAYKEYQAKVASGRKSFSQVLVEDSEERIVFFWKEPPVFTCELNWGHNHGMRVDYGETEFKDYPPDPADDENYDEL